MCIMMKKIVYLLVLFMFSLGTLSAQKKNVIEKSEDQVKMFNAQQRFYAGDYQGALNMYKDVLAGKPNDAGLMGHIAECYFEMGQFTEAQDNAEKAKAVDEKAYENTALILGKIYHMNGKLDDALVEYNAYKTLVGEGKKATESDVDIF